MPHSHESTVHFLDYWRVVRNRLPIIVTVFLLTFITGYILTFYYLDKVYDSYAQIRVEKNDKDVNFGWNPGGSAFDQVWFQTQYEIIQSQKILYPVIKQLNLQEKWAKRLMPDSQSPLRIDQAFDVLTLGGLEVSFKRGSNLIEIHGLSPDKAEAADIANEVAKSYMEDRTADAKIRNDRGMEQIAGQVREQEATVKKARDAVETLRQAGKGVNIGTGQPNTQVPMIEMELQRRSAALDEAKLELTARTVRYEQIKNLPPDKLVDLFPAMGIEDEALRQLRTELFQAEADYDQMKKSGLGEEHPKVTARAAQIRKFRDQINAVVEGKRDAFRIDLEVFKARVGDQERDVNALREKNRKEMTEIIIPFQEAQQEVERQQNLLDNLKFKQKQLLVDASIQDVPAQIVSSAVPEDYPRKPRVLLNLAIAGVMGLALGIGLAFFIEYLDTSVKTMDDVEKFLGIPVLTVIPEGVKPLIVEGPESPHAEAYRILRAKLDLSTQSSSGRTMTFVSGGPAEGKTTTLFNTAYVCAQAGQQVLIVDLDMRRPTVHKILQIDNDHGMSDVFLGRGEAYEYIRPTEVPNLHVITAGEMANSELGSFSGAKLREILEDLRLRYDTVMVDSPPVLGISEGAVISHEVDMTILVIQHRRYPRDISLRAKRALEEAKATVAGVVLNSVEMTSDESYYYYSSYGHYYANKGKKKPASRNGKHPVQNGMVPHVTAEHQPEAQVSEELPAQQPVPRPTVRAVRPNASSDDF